MNTTNCVAGDIPYLHAPLLRHRLHPAGLHLALATACPVLVGHWPQRSDGADDLVSFRAGGRLPAAVALAEAADATSGAMRQRHASRLRI